MKLESAQANAQGSGCRTGIRVSHGDPGVAGIYAPACKIRAKAPGVARGSGCRMRIRVSHGVPGVARILVSHEDPGVARGSGCRTEHLPLRALYWAKAPGVAWMDPTVASKMLPAWKRTFWTVSAMAPSVAAGTDCRMDILTKIQQ